MSDERVVDKSDADAEERFQLVARRQSGGVITFVYKDSKAQKPSPRRMGLLNRIVLRRRDRY